MKDVAQVLLRMLLSHFITIQLREYPRLYSFSQQRRYNERKNKRKLKNAQEVDVSTVTGVNTIRLPSLKLKPKADG